MRFVNEEFDGWGLIALFVCLLFVAFDVIPEFLPENGIQNTCDAALEEEVKYEYKWDNGWFEDNWEKDLSYLDAEYYGAIELMMKNENGVYEYMDARCWLHNNGTSAHVNLSYRDVK